MNHFYSELQTSPLLLNLMAAALKSCALLVVTWISAIFMRRRSAALRHMLWTLGLGLALAVLLLQTVMPSWKVLPSVKSAQNAALTAQPELPQAFSSDLRPIIPDAKTGLPATPPSRRKATAPTATATVTHSLEASTIPVSHTQAASLPARKFDWRFAALALWLFGICCCGAFYLVGEWKLRRLAKSAFDINNEDWIFGAKRIAQQLDIRRSVRILSSNDVEIPLTFGIRRPVIVVPAEAAEWSVHRREAVLRHELAHIARWDAVTQLVGHAACALYWFNPLVWFAARSARFDRELACDDLVLSAGAAPSEYAGELLTMVSKFQRREHYAVALAMARRSQFEGRLLALLNPHQDRKNVSRASAVAIATIAAILALPLAAMQPQEPQAPKLAAPATQAARPAPATPQPASIEAPAPPQQPEAQAEAAAPHAESGHVSAGPAMAPHPESTSVADAAAEAPHAMSGPEGRPNAAAAETPRAPEASTRPEHFAVMPPPNRQTGLECGVTYGVDGGVRGGVQGGVSGGVKGGVAGPTSHHSSSMSTEDDGHIKSMVVSWSDKDCNASLNSRGEIKFNDDFTAIQSIASDGFVEIASRNQGESRRLSIHPASGGQLEYVWWVNKNKQPFDDNGRNWVKNFLVELDRHSAWAVKQRLPRLLNEGGVQRVLDEVSYMGADYARSVYLRALLQERQLTPQELIRTLNTTAQLSSDYETAQVLTVIAAKYPLNDDASRNAFLSAINAISSDYEHARVLMVFFNKGPLPTAMAKSVLESASRLNSDFEHSRILVEMANRGLLDASTQADFLASVNNIKSDYEHARSLLAYLEARKSDDAAVLGVIKSVPQIKSDFEAASILTTVAHDRQLTGNMRDEYVKAAQNLRSEYERNRALAAVLSRPAAI